MCSSSKRKRINVEDKDKKGRTPFHYACNNGHLEIAGGTREVTLFQRLKIPAYPFDRCFKKCRGTRKVALLQGLEIPTCRSTEVAEPELF